MNKRILFLLVASIVLGAGVFGYVKHQQSVEVDTSIAAIIVANSVTANCESSGGSNKGAPCYVTTTSKGATKADCARPCSTPCDWVQGVKGVSDDGLSNCQ